jgi:hypothetical protein
VGRVSEGGSKDKPVPLVRDDLIAAAGEVPAVLAHLDEISRHCSRMIRARTVAITAAVLRAGALGGATGDELRMLAQSSVDAIFAGFKPADAPFTKLAKAALSEATSAAIGSGSSLRD